MSLSSITSRLRSLNDDVSRIQSKIADIARDEARASEKIASATSSMSRASSASLVERYSRDIERYQRDLARLQKKRADESRNLARKQQDLARCQKDLTHEQEREAKRTKDTIARLEAQSKQQQKAALQAASRHGAVPTPQRYDAFISHASEDKEELVKPLAEALIQLGHEIWYDDLQLTVGDSLRRSIDRGLASSRFGVVVLSPDFFAKNWPQYELDGLVAREQSGGEKVVLPLWHRVSKNDVLAYSPTLADRVALNTAMFTINELAAELHKVLNERGTGAEQDESS